MKQLYAPWRRAYSHNTEKNRAKPSDFCVFCECAKSPEDDEKNYVLKRLSKTFVLLNLFPYNGGHLLVVPFEHVDAPDKLDPQTRAEIMELATSSMGIMQQVLKPKGFNMGMNIGGSVAGGSIPDHIHMHVLPRWPGDTSFLPVLADTKPISENLLLLYQELKKMF